MTILAIILGAALGWVRWAWGRRQHDLRERYTPPAGDDKAIAAALVADAQAVRTGDDDVTVIGIDPSLAATGIAHADGTTLTVTYPKGCEGDRRLACIAECLTDNIGQAADLVRLAVIEDLPTHAPGAGKTGMAQGAIRLVLLEAGLQYAVVTPATLKKFATGKGNAAKADMRMALYKRAGIDLADDNQVDAWWLREMGLHHIGQPTISLPARNLEALGVVAWPEVAEATP